MRYIKKPIKFGKSLGLIIPKKWLAAKKITADTIIELTLIEKEDSLLIRLKKVK